MSSRWPKPGINHVGEYQASGHTLVMTGSNTRTIYLKYVASGITVSAIDADVDVTFFDSDHVARAFTVPIDSTASYKGKFLTFKVGAGADAIVSVTNIPSASYTPPSGSMLYRTQNDTFIT